MPSSTWRRDFEEHRRTSGRILLLIAGAIAAPLAWLMSLEAAFLLNYPVCWGLHRGALVAAVLFPIPVCIALAALIYRREPPRLRSDEMSWPSWMAALGMLTCLFFVFVALAMLAPIIGLEPCR